MLEVRSLAKRYGDVLALSDLTVSVAERSCLVLLGRNGAGKTTALRCMAGVLAPSAGTVRVDGIDAATEPAAVRARVYLKDLQAHGCALVICTHNMDEAEHLGASDDGDAAIGIMSAGRALAIGDMSSLRLRSGLSVRREVRELPTLQDIYLAIVG